MAQDDLIYDGVSATLGMDGSTEPSYLKAGLVHKAVNRTFRGFVNSTRPKQMAVDLVFVDVDGEADPEAEEVFRSGNVQGAHSYVKTSSLHDAGILVAVAGSIFFGKVSADRIIMTRIWGSYDPYLLSVWFVQGEEQVYIQNGKDRPLNWGGSGMAREIPEAEDKMPIGTLMAYSHGRVAVSDGRNLIAVSDHINSTGFADRTNMENFTENTTYIGGNFGTPSVIGEIRGMTTMAVSGERSGQGELVVFGVNGAATLDFRPPRSDWEDAKQILTGAGAVSPRGLVQLNNDIWYRRPDGIGSLKSSISDEVREWTDTPLSAEVHNWLSYDAPHLLRYSSGAFFDNRLFMTVKPERVSGDDYGDHRFSNGMVVLDFDKGSTVNPDSGFGWDGLWTGPRPAEIITTSAEGLERMFIVSHDEDGTNRIYEQTKIKGYDNGTIPIKSFFVTKKFSDFGGSSSVFSHKRLRSGYLRAVSRGESHVSAEYRNNHYPCWQNWLPETKVGCSTSVTTDPTFDPNTLVAAREHYRDIYFPDTYSDDEGSCELASYNRVDFGTQFQIKVGAEGSVDFPWVRIGAKRQEIEELASCSEPHPQDEEGTGCDLMNCRPENDFEYKIVE